MVDKVPLSGVAKTAIEIHSAILSTSISGEARGLLVTPL